jgi:F-type H+-transporting ATPase subunit c
MKKISAIILLVFMLMLCATAVFAAVAAEAVKAPTDAAHLTYFSNVQMACAIGIGIAAVGTGIGMGHGIGGACQGIARNPEASGKITVTMILGLALIESLAIYALVIVFIVLYMNPFKVV